MKTQKPFYDRCLNPITMWRDSRRDTSLERLKENRERRIEEKKLKELMLE